MKVGQSGCESERVTGIQDLGVLFTNKHVDFITAKVYLMLGFMMIICKEFDDTKAQKSIYYAHVRVILKYVVSTLAPIFAVHSVIELNPFRKKS